MNMDFINIIGIIAAIIAAIFAFLSYNEILREKIPHNTIIKATLEPYRTHFHRPVFPMDTHRIHIDKVKLSIKGADAKDVFVIAISNPKDFQKILTASREGKSIEEGDIGGDLFFPFCRLYFSRLFPIVKLMNGMYPKNHIKLLSILVQLQRRILSYLLEIKVNTVRWKWRECYWHLLRKLF